MADKHDAVPDADGGYPDWTELYNPGPQALSRSGCSLSDDPKDTGQGLLPDVALDAGASQVISASGRRESADPDEIHLPIRLDSDGASLLLRDPSGRIVDRVDSPAHREDASWERPRSLQEAQRVADGGASRLSLAPASGWTEAGYDDSSWTEIQLPVGVDAVDGDSTRRNLALFAPRTQSSDGHGFTGMQAVDDEWSSFSNTADGDLNPWWEVDLGQSRVIDAITLLDRLGCCAERLYNIEVEVRDETGAVTWTRVLLNPTSEGALPGSPGDRLDGGLDGGLEESGVGPFITVRKQAVNGVGSSKGLSHAGVQITGADAAPYSAWIHTDIGASMMGFSDTTWLRVQPAPVDFTPTRPLLEVCADDDFQAWLDGVAGAAQPVGSGVEVTGPGLHALPPHAEGLLAVRLDNLSVDDPDALLGLHWTAQAIDTQDEARAWFTQPSPGSPNGLGGQGFVADPEVDPPGASTRPRSRSQQAQTRQAPGWSTAWIAAPPAPPMAPWWTAIGQSSG